MSTIRFVLAALAVSTTAACSADPSSPEGETEAARDALGSATADVVSPRDPASGQAAPSTGKGSANPSPQPCVEVKLCPLGQTWDVKACACVGPINGGPSAGDPKSGPSTP